jgi:uncharacterized protein (DUF58 family)
MTKFSNLTGRIGKKVTHLGRREKNIESAIRFFFEHTLRLTQIAWVPSLLNPRHAFRFLWTGFVLMLVTCTLGVIAINTSTGLLYMLLGLLLGLWIVSAIFSTINLSGLSIARHVTGTSQVGQTLVITYLLTNHKRFFRSYSLVIEELGHMPIILPSGYCMSLEPGEQRQVVVTVTCRRRGHMRLRRVRVSSRFPFGLIAKCFVHKIAADVVVHPSLGRIRYELLYSPKSSASGTLGRYNRQTKGFEEFFGLREFQGQDNYHWIHWRSSAKLQKLMVKEMSEYNAAQLAVLLDTRVEDPLSLEQQNMLEDAVSFAATLIDRATERCLPIALVVSGCDHKVVNHGRGAAHRWALMTELAGVRMGKWESNLPDVGGFQPRTFTDAHFWVVGVGISNHVDDACRFHRNITVVDVQTEAFGHLFTPSPPALGVAKKIAEVRRD